MPGIHPQNVSAGRNAAETHEAQPIYRLPDVAAEQPEEVPAENWLPIHREDLEIDVILGIYQPDLEKLKTWKAPKPELARWACYNSERRKIDMMMRPFVSGLGALSDPRGFAMKAPRRLLGLILAGLVGMACAGQAPGGIHYASGKDSVTPDGLHRVEWEPFRVTYVKPGADLQRYDKVLVHGVSVSYKTPPHPDRLGGDAIDPNYALPDSAIASMERYFHEAFVKALGKSEDFAVVETPGAEVLLISGHIVNLQIQVPPEQDESVDETDYTASSGQMTLILDARDSKSGEPLVRVGQTRAIQMSDDGWYRSDPVANSSAVREIFQTWASDLQRELDQFHALPALPAVDTGKPPK